MKNQESVDVVLAGAGIMSATLALLLSILDESLEIVMLERLPDVAEESTSGWNNAGTGHAGYCELNYTPAKSNGEVEIQRALGINANFETSLQFWSALCKMDILTPETFIRSVPHLSVVWGEDVTFLKTRHRLLQAHHLFADMEFSQSPQQLEEWMPLVMQGRKADTTIAATRVAYGTDVDFGALTKAIIRHLQTRPNFKLLCHQQISALKQDAHTSWEVETKSLRSGEKTVFKTGFVFVGAGGASLSLLQKSGIAEAKGYAGFPVSGQWLVCHDPNIVQQHHAKVYGKAALGAPPMSVPHLDTRIIDGQPALLFGPYAGFTTKFLKTGSYWDLPASIQCSNLAPLLSVARHHADLTAYLVKESMQSHSTRMSSLCNYYPQAQSADWSLSIAGQRVQIIKPDSKRAGKLEFGTEIVSSQDGSLAALLGASPGASTSVTAMLEVLKRCFASRMQQSNWHTTLKSLIPSYGDSLIDNASLLQSVRSQTLSTLHLL